MLHLLGKANPDIQNHLPGIHSRLGQSLQPIPKKGVHLSHHILVNSLILHGQRSALHVDRHVTSLGGRHHPPHLRL